VEGITHSDPNHFSCPVDSYHGFASSAVKLEFKSVIIDGFRPVKQKLETDMMRFTQIAFAVMLLMAGLARAEDDLQVADLGDCQLDSGETISDCKVAYRVLGQLNADESNILVFPTWYGGSTKDLVTYGYVGPGKMADSDTYHVIAIEAFGNGLSSSPSNSTDQRGDSFPVISVRDMVRAQHRLLTEKLGVKHINTVMGASMGGMQVFEWMTTFPGFMDNAVPIEGTPWPTAYDLMLWSAWLDAIDTDKGDADSNTRAAKLLASLDGLTLWTPEYFNGMVEADKFTDFFDGFSSGLRGQDLANRRAQTVAVLSHDISKPFTDFENNAASIIKARTLVVGFDSDHMVNPVPSMQLANMIGAEVLLIEGNCGHMAPNPDCAQAEVANAIHKFLSKELKNGGP
jgi:homoserine O-acetyltransferase